MTTYEKLAIMMRTPNTPDTDPAFDVRVELVRGPDGSFKKRSIVVVEAESYVVASQLCDALDYLFSNGGALAGLGRMVVEQDGEVGRLAVNFERRLRLEPGSFGEES